MIWIDGHIISRNSCIITCRWATLGSLTKWIMLHREGIWIIFEAKSPWLHVGVCRRVLSPRTLPCFWRCESCHRGSSRSCKWDSIFQLFIFKLGISFDMDAQQLYENCGHEVEKISHMKWTETRHVAQCKIPGLENLRATTSAGSKKRNWLKRQRTMNSSSPEVPVGAMHASARVCQVMSLHCYAVMLCCLKIQIPLQLYIFIEALKTLNFDLLIFFVLLHHWMCWP